MNPFERRLNIDRRHMFKHGDGTILVPIKLPKGYRISGFDNSTLSILIRKR